MPDMDARFRAAEEAYFALRGKLSTGRIARAEFDAELRALTVQDAQGRFWALGADNAQWHLYDGTQWVAANPPTQTPPAGGPPALPESRPAIAPLPAGPAPRANPAPAQSGGGCGRTIGCGCLALVLLVLLCGIGGYFAFQNRLITQTTILNLAGLGPGDIEVDNFRDDQIAMRVTQTDPGKDPVPLDEISLSAFDVKSFRIPQPGRVRVEFLSAGRANLAVCTLTIRSGDRYQFVALPDKFVVNRVGSPPSTGRDLILATSSLCR
ncbi:MAG: hypothetical protein HZB53_11395 [Chloroflexi bacterium]|nr:hypothetical protein [Chloroflexota bacterium]